MVNIGAQMMVGSYGMIVGEDVMMDGENTRCLVSGFWFSKLSNMSSQVRKKAIVWPPLAFLMDLI